MTKTRLGLSLLLLAATSEVVCAAQPWDQPFSPNTADILKSAVALPLSDDAEILYLLQDHHYEVASNGATVSVYRCLYRVAKQSAVEDWSEVEQEWEPWHENKPELRARVISSDGSVHWLDPKTIADAPASQLDDTIFSDSRVIRAPLPAMAEGAVIEYEVVQHETAALFAAGVTRQLLILTAVPLERFHVSIDAAKGVSLKSGFSAIPESDIDRSESKTGTHIEVNVGRQTKVADFEPDTPSDLRSTPSFGFSTGTSWKKVASLYQQIVNEKIAAVDTKSLIAALGLDPTKLPTSPLALASEITSHLHLSVRYTGVEFGQSAIVPNAPSEVIRRHYGDCKDKATLLTALLKGAGLNAHVALLSAGYQSDVDPNLPGLGLFDHAIVFVNGAKPLWIDATADTTRVGDLPIQDQGRHALIVDESTQALTLTPMSTSRENRIAYSMEIHLPENGKANIHAEVDAVGSFESRLRRLYSGDAKQVRDQLERFAKAALVAKSLGASDVTPARDFSKPFHISLEGLESGVALADANEAGFAVSSRIVTEDLPYILLSQSSLTSKEQEKARVHDFVFREPFQATARFKIWPPRGSSPKPLPSPVSAKVGDFLFTFESKLNADGSVELNYLLDTGKPRLTAAEFTSLKQQLAKVAQPNPTIVAFTFKSGDLMALGKSADALRVVQQEVSDHPNEVVSYIRYAKLLMECGAGEAALVNAQKAVELDPRSVAAWSAQGDLKQYDSFGRFRAPGWKPADAEKALRKALELDPDNPEILTDLAGFLEYDSSGRHYSDPVRLAEAEGIYRRILAKKPDPGNSINLILALLHLGQPKAAREELPSLAGQRGYEELTTIITAILDGADRAIIDSQSSVDARYRGQLLSTAAGILVQLRQYPEAIALLDAEQRFSDGTQSDQLLTYLGKVKRYQDVLAKDDDPVKPVQALLLAVAGFDLSGEKFSSFLSASANGPLWQVRLFRARQNLTPYRQAFLKTGGTLEAVADLLLSHATLTLRGSGNPYFLIDVTSDFNLGFSTVAVVEENGKYKLLAPNDGLDVIGKRALELLERGNLQAAQEWLDGVKDIALPVLPTDDKGPAFRYLWSGTAPETRNAAFVRAAAASLLGTYSGSDEAARILRASAEHPAQFMDRQDLYFALCETFKQASKWQDLLETSRLLAKSVSYSEFAYRFGAEAHIQLQQWKELEAEAEARLQVSESTGRVSSSVVIKTGQPASKPAIKKIEDGWALHYKALALMRQGRFDEAQPLIERAKEAPYHSRHDEELSQSWNAILAGKAAQPGDQRETSSRSLAETDLTHLYTVAMTLLVADRLTEGKKVLDAALDKEEAGGQVSSLAWLVQGEMLKRYGLLSDAKNSFQVARRLNDWTSLPMAQFLLDREENRPPASAKP